jgi:hypothetical protein
MELPTEISNKKVVLAIAISLILLFFLYRAYVNSRQALQILETQVPNITRVAFETEVFALTQGNLDAVLKRFTGFAAASDVEKYKKEFDSYLWMGVAIRNRGLKNAAEVSARIRLSTPIKAIQGFNSTVYARLETQEGGIGKPDALLRWTYLEPRSTSLILLGVQPEDFNAKPPYSNKEMQIWSRDYKVYFELAEISSKEGAFDFAY